MGEGTKQESAAARSLLDAYAEICGRETRGVRDDLAQLDGLLADAAARLAASFERLSALASRCCTDAYIEPRPAANDAPQDAPAPAAARPASDEAASAFSEAVTALQFQDIASQLVGHAAARLEALERIASELARLGDASPEALSRTLAAAHGDLRASPVGQRRLSEGAVELF